MSFSVFRSIKEDTAGPKNVSNPQNMSIQENSTERIIGVVNLLIISKNFKNLIKFNCLNVNLKVTSPNADFSECTE